MRTDTITIGGQPYPVKGLSAIQTMVEDIATTEANANAKGDHKVRAHFRLRKLALVLQNGDAFLPDPKNPNGQFAAKDKTTDEVAIVLDGDLFLHSAEFYDAEMAVMRLNGLMPDAPAKKSASPAEGAKTGEGE